ncbi:MAG: S8 family serine peptidase, partial [Deltaproteobacteria bacterium]|nr:S8 family serine peptidase [Deltaproteobacteria bacterium]
MVPGRHSKVASVVAACAIVLFGLPGRSDDFARRCIVQLEGAPAGRRATVIDAQHAAFRSRLAKLAPGARIDWEYRVLFNGYAVAGSTPERLERMPGVARVWRTDTAAFSMDMDASLDLIKAQDLWDKAGGAAGAGEGVRIAVIDSGIDERNPFFSPAGYAPLDGFPKGETAYTTAKIIAARAYFRPDDPVDASRDEATPRDHIGHGSHCAGIAAGNHGTVFDVGGFDVEVSGVAPRARLMSYKVFYLAASGSEAAYEPEIMAAMEDAVADGADVIAISWSAPDLLGPDAPSAAVFRAAVDGGGVVVASAGDKGGGPGTVRYPGTLAELITVGSVETGRGFAGWLDVAEPAPDALRGIPAVKGDISPGFENDPVGPARLVSARQAGDASGLACGPFPWGAFDGAIALVERGECLFSEKVMNVYLAGAVAVVVFNNQKGISPVTMAGDPVPIPAVQIGNKEGIAVEKWVLGRGDAMATIRDGMARYERPEEIGRLSGWSGRGPTDVPLAKPDVVAPGRPILSATAHELGSTQTDPWSVRQGTSMAAAHVAGTAALVRQLHPNLGPDRIAAAIVGTATTGSFADATSPASVGSGLIDLGRLAGLEAVALPAGLSFGEAYPGAEFEATLRLEDLGWQGAQPIVSWEHTASTLGLTVSPADGDTAPLGQDVHVSVRTTRLSDLGEHTGFLRFIGQGEGRETTVPYHFRLKPEATRDLIIVDLSYLPPEQTGLMDMYADMAERAGLDFEIHRDENDKVPLLRDLLKFRAALVVTGDDQVRNKEAGGMIGLDRLSSFARKGGSIVVTGQGALRGTTHERIVVMLGAATRANTPLTDPQTFGLVKMDSYRAMPTGPVVFIDAPLDLGPQGDGRGDLALAGELESVQGPELSESWTSPFLVMQGPYFEAGGYVGMLFDPYQAYGVSPEAELLRHRAALLGFGFERINGDVPGAASRDELFGALMRWVLARISVTAEVETSGLHVIVTASTSGAKPVSYEYDFGDGSKRETSASRVAYHEYDAWGDKTITVIARGELGAAS